MPCCGAGDAGAAAQPDWAGLPEPLWRRVCEAAPDPALQPDNLHSCMRWFRLVASVSCSCTSLRRALLAPGADRLWTVAIFSAAHPGLTPQQFRAVSALGARQGPCATSLQLFGGGWSADELCSVLGALTGLHERVWLQNIHSAAEAAVISRALATLPVQYVFFSGTAACILPSAARELCLHGEVPLSSVPLGGTWDQAPFQRFLGCLRPLRSLRSLVLRLETWGLTRTIVESVAVRHPQLQKLHLHLHTYTSIGRHAVETLRLLSSVQLSLSVVKIEEDGSLALLLQQLQGVQLLALDIDADTFSLLEEALRPAAASST